MHAWNYGGDKILTEDNIRKIKLALWDTDDVNNVFRRTKLSLKSPALS